MLYNTLRLIFSILLFCIAVSAFVRYLLTPSHISIGISLLFAVGCSFYFYNDSFNKFIGVGKYEK